MSQEQLVLYEKKGHISYITLNRPEKLNAENVEFMDQQNDAVYKYAKDRDAWCAIITGNGRAFSVGADLDWEEEVFRAGKTSREVYGRYFYEAFRECSKPLIAAINGYCLAGGLNIAINCDFRIASEKAIFGMPELRYGIGAKGGHWEPHIWHLAMGDLFYLIMTGQQIGAEQALRMRLVQEVVPHAKLMERATELANMVCGMSPLAVRYEKRVVKHYMDPTFGKTGLALTYLYGQEVAGSEDVNEGVRSWVEKRKPKWKNR